YGTTLREAQQESLDLVFALDVSVSMLAEDVAPSRLERARLAIARMAEARRGDRLGLVVFAGDAFLQCPLTGDHAAFRLFLDAAPLARRAAAVPPGRLGRARLAIARMAEARRGDRLGLVVFAGDAFLQCPLTGDHAAFRLFLDAADPGLVATQGTDFANALFTARRAFADEDGAAGPPRTRAVVVVSDGEDHEGGLEDAADALRREGVTLLAVGVGTERGGPIPVFRSGQRVGYKTDA